MLSVKESTDVILSWEGGGVLPYERLMGMCRWMGSHFHDQTASSVSFSSDLVRGSARARERWAAKPQGARNEGVLLDGPRKKRDCS